MSASFLVRPEAESDLAEAQTWYDEQRVGLGDEFITAVESAFEPTRDFPQGYAVEYRQVRAAPLRRFPYVVFYRLIGEVVQVLAVMHGSRHSREWQSRI